MSLTLTKVQNGFDVWGKSYATLYDIACDTSYPLTNGYVINATDVGLKNFLGAQVVGSNKAAGAVLVCFDLGATYPSGMPVSSLAFRLFLPTGGATAPATLTAPVVAVTEGAITNGAITVTNGAITAGAITVTNGAITAGAITFPTNTTPVLSDNSHPVFTAANPTQATTTASEATPSQATTTASQASSTIAAGTGALTAGIGKEVGNTTNVSTLTYRVRFIGF